MQRSNEGVNWAQFPGRRINMVAPNDWGASKSPYNDTSTFFNSIDLLPKDLKYEHGSTSGDSEGAWVGHDPHIFAWPPVFPPQFFS